METWTRNEEHSWKQWSHPALGLDAIANASPPVVALLVIATDAEDDEQLVAAVRLARQLATTPLEVVAASVHPSLRWLESVREAGADRALLVPRPNQCRRCKQPPLDDVVELSGSLCPELHAKSEHKVSLSVCGKHNDRMVLARHHFDRWCLAAKEACPHWQGVSHD